MAIILKMATNTWLKMSLEPHIINWDDLKNLELIFLKNYDFSIASVGCILNKMETIRKTATNILIISSTMLHIINQKSLFILDIFLLKSDNFDIL